MTKALKVRRQHGGGWGDHGRVLRAARQKAGTGVLPEEGKKETWGARRLVRSKGVAVKGGCAVAHAGDEVAWVRFAPAGSGWVRSGLLSYSRLPALEAWDCRHGL